MTSRAVVAKLAVLFLLCAPRVLWTAEPNEVRTLKKLPSVAPKSPAEAIGTFQIEDGFRMELLAAEPLVFDPVAMQYDENGLAYVVEMSDYPFSDKSKDIAWKEQTSLPIGRVRILEDSDGDGRFDRSTIFAEKLSWPTGLAFWKGGVFVAATPDIWYFKDTNGDRKANIQRKVFTGFRKFNVQAVMNNLKWGLDHRIYGAGSSNGGNILPGDDLQAKPIRLGRGDFRFDARGGKLEVISGGARFGNTFDDWGNRFICNIRNPAQHIVLPARYLRRNPFLAVSTAIHDAAEAGDALPVYRVSPPEAWRVINAKRLAANTSKKSPRSETVAAGFVTSSSGITIYRGAAYPREYYGNAFIGEVAGNLVMRYRLTVQGPTFRATRAHQKVEFLASTDNWFRPVNFVNAPDGTLHILDMARETIEHPWSIPEDIKARLDLLSGRDRGRIYRLVPREYPKDFQKPGRPRLGEVSIKQLVATLENPNSWWRETAHRLLFERQDKSAIEPLRALLRNSPSSLARLHALWSLSGLNGLRDEDLLRAIQDRDGRLRRHAVGLSESQLASSPALLSKVLAAADDPDQRVRFQVALSLGESGSPRTAEALVRIVKQGGDDPWTQTAVLSSLSEGAHPFLVRLLGDKSLLARQEARPMISRLTGVVADRAKAKDLEEVVLATAATEDLTIQMIVISELARARRKIDDDLVMGGSSDPASEAQKFLEDLFTKAKKISLDQQAEVELRRLAISLVGFGDYALLQEVMPKLLDSRQPRDLQEAAIVSLSLHSDSRLGTMLLKAYPSLTPRVRAQVIEALLSRELWVPLLLDAIKSRSVMASEVSLIRWKILREHKRADIRELAIKLSASQAVGPRKEVIARYRPALALSADVERGRKVFRRECLNCHRLGKEGHNVGPNLATVRNRTAEEVLVHLLDPNREVSPNYLQYVIATDSGLIATGIIASETPSSITLRQAEDKQLTILRSEIDAIRSTGSSLMPEGLEKKITPQQMADLIAYVVALK